MSDVNGLTPKFATMSLGELEDQGYIKLGRGKVISKTDLSTLPGIYPVYSSAQEKDGKFGEYGKYMFDEELITWSVDGGGRIFYRHKHRFSVTNVGGTLRVLNQDRIYCRFLFYILDHLHSTVKFDWVQKAHPSVIRDVYDKIPLPLLDEQRRIAEVLRSVDEAIAATKAVYEAAISAQASAFETFLQSGNALPGSAPVTGWTTGKIDGVRRLPAGWQIVKLVDVARLESGHTPDRKKPEYWDGGDVEWISLHDTQNLERCDISETDMRITQAGLANSSARLLPPGTVCFSRTATVGKCVIMAKSMATSQDFANFICSPKLNNRYLLHLMRWMQPVWKALASGSTHKTIYMPTFKALQIVLPPRAEQDGIAATMDSFVNVAEGHAASLTRLRSMKAAIMSDLLSGRVRVAA